MYWKYFNYIVKHKWFVFLECCKAGIVWRGIVHDLDKFRLDKFVPYAKHFFGTGTGMTTGRDKSGYYKPYDTGDADFDIAWFLHQKRNRHHWQWWCMPKNTENSNVKVFEMQYPYNLEMICDWNGAGRAIHGRVEIVEFYVKNKENMILHPATREWVELKLNISKKE